MARPQRMASDTGHPALFYEMKAAVKSVNCFSLHELPFRVSLRREYKTAPALGGLESAYELDFAP
jgi:hypothetical protein